MTDAYPGPPRADFDHAMRRVWWLPLLRGLVLIVLGFYALVYPGMTVAAFAVVIGVFSIVDGLLVVLAGLDGRIATPKWTLIRGIASILIGLFVVAFPMLVTGVAATILLYLLALTVIACGILELIGASQLGKYSAGSGWLATAGVLSILLGGLILIAPITFGLVIVRVLGGFAVVSGISLIAFALRLRKLLQLPAA